MPQPLARKRVQRRQNRSEERKEGVPKGGIEYMRLTFKAHHEEATDYDIAREFEALNRGTATLSRYYSIDLHCVKQAAHANHGGT